MAQLKEGTTIGGVDILHILDLLDVELGRNDNGVWVRLKNGLQICFIVRSPWPGTIADISTGELFRGEAFTWTFPKPFIEEPFFAGSASGSNWIVDNGGYNRNNTENMILQTRRASKSTADPIVRLAAIGFWKEPDL